MSRRRYSAIRVGNVSVALGLPGSRGCRYCVGRTTAVSPGRCGATNVRGRRFRICVSLVAKVVTVVVDNSDWPNCQCILVVVVHSSGGSGGGTGRTALCRNTVHHDSSTVSGVRFLPNIARDTTPRFIRNGEQNCQVRAMHTLRT